jgi:general secretion pathway protein M
MSPPARERLEAWYAALNSREQLIVRIGAIAGGLLLVVGIVLRLHGVVQTAEKRVATKRAAVSYIQGVLPELRDVPPPAGAGQSLVAVIDRTTRDSGLNVNLKGTEPSGTSGVRVRLESASFAQLLLWLLKVEQEYGLSIQAATLERTDAPGRVNASLTFVRS